MTWAQTFTRFLLALLGHTKHRVTVLRRAKNAPPRRRIRNETDEIRKGAIGTGGSQRQRETFMTEREMRISKLLGGQGIMLVK